MWQPVLYELGREGSAWARDPELVFTKKLRLTTTDKACLDLFIRLSSLMANPTDTALSLFRANYNCAQAVAFAFADELGIARDTALRITRLKGKLGLGAFGGSRGP